MNQMNQPFSIQEDQIITGPLFNEPMRVETAHEGSSGSWTVNLLKEKKDEIEAEFNDTLEWLEMPQYRACSIKKEIIGGVGWKADEQKWNESHQEAVETMVKLSEATKEHILKIKI